MTLPATVSSAATSPAVSRHWCRCITGCYARSGRQSARQSIVIDLSQPAESGGLSGLTERSGGHCTEHLRRPMSLHVS